MVFIVDDVNYLVFEKRVICLFEMSIRLVFWISILLFLFV